MADAPPKTRKPLSPEALAKLSVAREKALQVRREKAALKRQVLNEQ
jgi:hypothetical protein